MSLYSNGFSNQYFNYKKIWLQFNLNWSHPIKVHTYVHILWPEIKLIDEILTVLIKSLTYLYASFFTVQDELNAICYDNYRLILLPPH